jgi:hypothetical protein
MMQLTSGNPPRERHGWTLTDTSAFRASLPDRKERPLLSCLLPCGMGEAATTVSASLAADGDGLVIPVRDRTIAS